MTSTAGKQRYAMIDALRGLALVNMIAYHGVWDLVNLAGVKVAWYTAVPGFVWQQCICWSFILLSGFCWKMGRKPWKNGVKVSAAGALVTLVTALVLPDEVVWCGVLSFLGMAILLMIPLERLLKRCPPLYGLLGSAALFLLTYRVPDGMLLFRFALPEWLYQCPVGFVFGFPTADFYSSDYFPLLPWLFLYIAGYFLHRLVKPSLRRVNALYRKIPMLDALGQHSLPVYMVHQPVLYGVLEIVRWLGA